MNNKIISAVRVSLLGVITAALGLGTGLTLQRQDPSGPWIKTRQRLTLLSANDGQAHLKLDTEGKINKKNFTQDSITAIQLSPDHPPVIETIYGTVPNTILGAHYYITGKLGQGGMGEVFLAHNTSLERKVALKFLPDIFSGDPEWLARFERDAWLLGPINPPNAAIVRRIRPLSAVVERCIG